MRGAGTCALTHLHRLGSERQPRTVAPIEGHIVRALVVSRYLVILQAFLHECSINVQPAVVATVPYVAPNLQVAYTELA